MVISGTGGRQFVDRIVDRDQLKIAFKIVLDQLRAGYISVGYLAGQPAT